MQRQIGGDEAVQTHSRAGDDQSLAQAEQGVDCFNLMSIEPDLHHSMNVARGPSRDLLEVIMDRPVTPDGRFTAFKRDFLDLLKREPIAEHRQQIEVYGIVPPRVEPDGLSQVQL